KAAQVILWPFVAEVVEEQEGIEFLRVAEAEGAVQPDAGALHGGLGGAGIDDGTDGHGASPVRRGDRAREYRARRRRLQPAERAHSAQDLCIRGSENPQRPAAGAGTNAAPARAGAPGRVGLRSEEHTSELQ